MSEGEGEGEGEGEDEDGGWLTGSEFGEKRMLWR